MKNQNYIALKHLEVYQLSRKLSALAWKIYSDLNYEQKKIKECQKMKTTFHIFPPYFHLSQRYFYLFLFISFLFISIFHHMNAQTLDGYLQKAAESNPGLQAKFSEYYTALEKIPQVGALPDPKVTLGYYILPVETRVGPRLFDVGLSQSFPWFGTLAARKDQAAQWAAARYQDFMAVKNELFYQVREVYYRLWVTDRNIAIYQEYLDILEVQEQTTLAQVEVATSSLADVLRIQMERKEITAQLEWLQDNRKTLEAEMNSLLSQPLGTPLAVDSSLVLLSPDTNETGLLDSIMVNNPSIKALQEQQLAFEKQKEVASKSGMPSFGLGVNYATVSRRTDTDMDVPQNGQDILMPMATLSIPLYRNKYKAMVKEADYRMQGVQQQLEDTKNNLAADFILAVNQYRDAERKTKLYTELLKQAQETLEMLTTAYMTATEDYEEVLRMQQQLLKYQLELEHTKSNQNTAVALLEKLMAKGIE